MISWNCEVARGTPGAFRGHQIEWPEEVWASQVATMFVENERSNLADKDGPWDVTVWKEGEDPDKDGRVYVVRAGEIGTYVADKK